MVSGQSDKYIYSARSEDAVLWGACASPGRSSLIKSSHNRGLLGIALGLSAIAVTLTGEFGHPPCAILRIVLSLVQAFIVHKQLLQRQMRCS